MKKPFVPYWLKNGDWLREEKPVDKLGEFYRVEVFAKDGVITSDIVHDFGDIRNSMVKRILDTNEELIKEQLVKLGWTPPGGEKDKRKDDILYRLARLARNTDGLYPSTWGAQVGRLLTNLRAIDQDRYDLDVMGPIEQCEKL